MKTGGNYPKNQRPKCDTLLTNGRNASGFTVILIAGSDCAGGDGKRLIRMSFRRRGKNYELQVAALPIQSSRAYDDWPFLGNVFREPAREFTGHQVSEPLARLRRQGPPRPRAPH